MVVTYTWVRVYWLSQALEYAKTIREQLFRQGIRVEVDSGNDRLAKQIRNAEQQRVPVMCIIGAKVSEGRISLV